MKQKTARHFIAVMVSTFVASVVLGCSQDAGSQAPQQSTPDSTARAHKMAEFLSQRNEAVRWAIETLKGPKTEFNVRGPEIMAVRVLRELRACEGVQFLLPLVQIKTPVLPAVSGGREVNLGDWYPAAGALAEIGKPSLDFCLPALARTAFPLERQNLCWVIGEIHGAEVGRYVVELAIRDEKDAERKANLNEALKVYDAVWDPDDDSLRRPRGTSQGIVDEEPVGEPAGSRAPSP